MEKLTRIMLCVSSIFALIMAGLCFYAGAADSMWYGLGALCLLVAVWFGISFVKSTKEAKEKDKKQK